MILVLGGVRGSGKDTVGALLVNNYGFKKDAFANPLKEMVKKAFPAFTDEDLYGPSSRRETQYEEYPFSGDCVACGTRCELLHHGWVCPRCSSSYPAYLNPRIALQTLGTEWGRRLYSEVWVDAAFRRIQGQGNYVITDCRFRNEVQRSAASGAFTVKLTRGLDHSSDTHQSEAEFRTIPNSFFSYVLDNAALSLAELPEAVAKMMEFMENMERVPISK